jgi:POT family proton-dependent oligopeptide transporter
LNVILTTPSAEALQHGQHEAEHKPHLYGATVNDANVAGAHTSIEKPGAVEATSSDSSILEEDDGMGGVKPTAEDLKTLRKVGEPLPKSAFLVALVELCERKFINL